MQTVWPYSPHDKTTWKYLGVTTEKGIGYRGMILNPKFAYSHLDDKPRDPRDRLPKNSEEFLRLWNQKL